MPRLYEHSSNRWLPSRSTVFGWQTRRADDVPNPDYEITDAIAMRLLAILRNPRATCGGKWWYSVNGGFFGIQLEEQSQHDRPRVLWFAPTIATAREFVRAHGALGNPRCLGADSAGPCVFISTPGESALPPHNNAGPPDAWFWASIPCLEERLGPAASVDQYHPNFNPYTLRHELTPFTYQDIYEMPGPHTAPTTLTGSDEETPTVHPVGSYIRFKSKVAMETVSGGLINAPFKVTGTPHSPSSGYYRVANDAGLSLREIYAAHVHEHMEVVEPPSDLEDEGQVFRIRAVKNADNDNGVRFTVAFAPSVKWIFRRAGFRLPESVRRKVAEETGFNPGGDLYNFRVENLLVCGDMLIYNAMLRQDIEVVVNMARLSIEKMLETAVPFDMTYTGIQAPAAPAPDAEPF